MAAEGTEFIPQADIDGHAIDTLNGTRGNRQTAFIQPGFNISVTKTHGTFSFRASPLTVQGQTKVISERYTIRALFKKLADFRF
jgi:hypothetical protein